MTGLVLCTLRRRSRTGLSPVSYELKTVYHRVYGFSTEKSVEDMCKYILPSLGEMRLIIKNMDQKVEKVCIARMGKRAKW